MKRQDRQGARTPAALEQKYDFEQFFEEIEGRLEEMESNQHGFAKDAKEELASLKESAADNSAALSSLGERLEKTEQNALRLELAIKKKGGNTSSADLSGIEKELEETNKRLDELNEKVSELEQSGTSFETDKTLTLEEGVLSVNVATEIEQGNTLPVSSAAVYALAKEVGEALSLVATKEYVDEMLGVIENGSY